MAAGREICRLAGLAESHSYLLEQRKHENVTAVTLIALARVYGVSLDWLALGRGEKPSPEDVKAAVDRARSGVSCAAA